MKHGAAGICSVCLHSVTGAWQTAARSSPPCLLSGSSTSPSWQKRQQNQQRQPTMLAQRQQPWPFLAETAAVPDLRGSSARPSLAAGAAHIAPLGSSPRPADLLNFKLSAGWRLLAAASGCCCCCCCRQGSRCTWCRLLQMSSAKRIWRVGAANNKCTEKKMTSPLTSKQHDANTPTQLVI